MRSGESHGSKLVFLFIMVIIFYLAFFGFNIENAVNYALLASGNTLHALGL